MSLRHSERHAAIERALACRHLDRASGRAGRHVGGDFRFRDDLKLRRRAVEGDAGRAAQIRSQDSDGCSDLARVRERFDKRAQTHGQAEHRPTAKLAGSAGAAGEGCPVKFSAGGLNHTPVGIGAVLAVKVVQRRQLATGSDFEDRAKVRILPVIGRSTVQIPVGSPGTELEFAL